MPPRLPGSGCRGTCAGVLCCPAGAADVGALVASQEGSASPAKQPSAVKRRRRRPGSRGPGAASPGPITRHLHAAVVRTSQVGPKWGQRAPQGWMERLGLTMTLPGGRGRLSFVFACASHSCSSIQAVCASRQPAEPSASSKSALAAAAAPRSAHSLPARPQVTMAMAFSSSSALRANSGVRAARGRAAVAVRAAAPAGAQKGFGKQPTGPLKDGCPW